MTINRFCSSGLQAIAIAAGAVAIGSVDVVIAGGVESMTMVPMTGNKISASPEAMRRIPTAYTPMGITRRTWPTASGSRASIRTPFAAASHRKAVAARAAGKFDREIVPVTAVRYRGDERVGTPFRTDELIRADTTAEGLAGLKPAFAATGSVRRATARPSPTAPPPRCS